MAQRVKNPTCIQKDVGSIPALAQWVEGSSIVTSCSSDLALPWLWRRPAAAAPIGPLAWELPCAAGVTLKSRKQKQNKTL